MWHTVCCVCGKQIRAFVALGPVVTAGHIQGFARYLSDAVVEETVIIKYHFHHLLDFYFENCFG